jgi:indolepyruvate ferredoxin oxidoreductase
VIGKRNGETDPLFPLEGELTADIIAPALAKLLTERGGFPSVEQWLSQSRSAKAYLSLPLIARTPYFCSGCPHNSSTKVPDGSMVGAGIGCHGMVTLMDDKLVGSVTGFTQMGGEGTQWIGMGPFVRQTHLLQNIGDGTFHHSGSLAVRAAVAAGANITYKVLYNSAVAMTGGQHAEGALGVGDLTRSLLAEGVARIIVTTDKPKRYRPGDLPRGVQCWHRDRLEEAQLALAGTPGVTVLVHDQECAAELRRKRKRGNAIAPRQRVMINERVCEGCGDCGIKSNCLSVHPVDTELGRKTQIDQSSCNFDFSCLKGDCPAFMTIIPDDSGQAKLEVAPLGADDLSEPVEISTMPHTTRITGIGGTGVVTISQILTTAATMAGRFVRSLDQTGLAQKGGAVVSDIKIAEQSMTEANRAGEGECDLYLGCDLLVAADSRYLRSANPSRTVAVVSTSAVPTGSMVTDTGTTFPAIEEVTTRILDATQAQDAVFLDARALATVLLGQDQFANMLLLGAAYQAGRLPIRAEHIEEAIRQGHVKVEENLQAFRRGRQAVAAPAELESTLAGLREPTPRREVSSRARDVAALVRTTPGSALSELVVVRVSDLIAYQSVSYARRYAEFVEMVRAAEAARVPGNEGFALAVARYLYKLMAYKDEYEVPRLSLDEGVDMQVRKMFGARARVSYKLHPPFLRAVGVNRKITLGPWVRPLFRLLAAMRFLRGTVLDPFGHTEVRRTERQLITEYRAAIVTVTAILAPENHDIAIELAGLPDVVRGYEGVKLANVDRYRKLLAELMSKLMSQTPPRLTRVG